MRTTFRLVLALGLTAVTITASSAQTRPGSTQSAESPQSPAQPQPAIDRPSAPPLVFISVNGGYQVGKQDFGTRSDFTVFDEPASLTTSGEVASAPVFDFGAAYRINDEFAVGGAFSILTTDGDVAVVAQVPHPILTDQPREATYTAAGLKHRQPALHFQAIWTVPFTTKVDFAVSGGPSLVFVTHEVVSAAALQPEAPPFTSPAIDSVTVTEESKTAFGINIGFDATYLVTPRYGVGFTGRYVWASADIPGLTDKLTVGGLQLLGGLRVRF